MASKIKVLSLGKKCRPVQTLSRIWMLIIVMANPIQVTKVNAVPLYSGGAVCATSAENWGESEITVIPQTIIKPRKSSGLICKQRKETKQQSPEIPSE